MQDDAMSLICIFHKFFSSSLLGVRGEIPEMK